MKEKKSRIDELYDAHDELIGLAYEMLQSCQAKKKKKCTDSRKLMSFYFRRAWEMYESFVVLIKANRLVDAALLLRSLYNMTVDVSYMMVDLDKKENRAMQYMLKGNEAQIDLLKNNIDRFKEWGYGDHSSRLAELKENQARVIEELENAGEYERIPSQIKQRAERAGDIVLSYYDMVYKPFSNIEHHNIFFGKDYVDDENCEPIENPKRIFDSAVFKPEITLYMCKGLFLEVLKAFNEAFQLNWRKVIKQELQKHKEEFNLYKKERGVKNGTNT